MNRYMEQKWVWIEETHKARARLLDSLSDADLTFSPGGRNMTFGALVRESGDVERAYIDSLRTLTMDWSTMQPNTTVEGSVDQLRAWFQALDQEMKSLVAELSDEDLAQSVDRAGYATPRDVQLDVYLQALLIFLGKASIFIRAMDRALPAGMEEFIG